jgi:hypothetical protein
MLESDSIQLGKTFYFSADAIKSGHDISEFLGCPDFCSSYALLIPSRADTV